MNDAKKRGMSRSVVCSHIIEQERT